MSVAGTAINFCPPSICWLLPWTSFFGFSTHLLGFVYEMVRFIPVGKKVCCLFIIDPDVMICK